MFGEMNVVRVIDLRHTPEDVRDSVDGAVARLLHVADYPTVAKWVQLPRALFVLLLVPGDPESGAFYVYDRRLRVWYWVDFEDDKFGGYTTADFERLVRECRFLDIVEHPHLLAAKHGWIVESGLRPRSRGLLSRAVGKPAEKNATAARNHRENPFI